MMGLEPISPDLKWYGIPDLNWYDNIGSVGCCLYINAA
tara:strand:- start:2069 stop:2182 length:114 start_codon:yes stop_codon:yes gene_type:complete